MKTDRTTALLTASREVFEKANAFLLDLCTKYNMEFKATETPCINDVTEWTFLCGQFNTILHLNYSQADSYFSVRTLIRKYGRTPGQFTPETLRERKYTMLHSLDGSATWVSQDNSGDKADAQGIADICLQDMVEAISPKG